jgi:hypothetical protein
MFHTTLLAHMDGWGVDRHRSFGPGHLLSHGDSSGFLYCIRRRECGVEVDSESGIYICD